MVPSARPPRPVQVPPPAPYRTIRPRLLLPRGNVGRRNRWRSTRPAGADPPRSRTIGVAESSWGRRPTRTRGRGREVGRGCYSSDLGGVRERARQVATSPHLNCSRPQRNGLGNRPSPYPLPGGERGGGEGRTPGVTQPHAPRASLARFSSRPRVRASSVRLRTRRLLGVTSSSSSSRRYSMH